MAVQITMLVPTLKTAGALLVMAIGPQLSATTGVPRATFVFKQRPGSALRFRLEGQTIEGAIVSETTIALVQELVLPEPSTAVKTTGFVPKARLAPARGVWVTVTGLQLS